MLFPAVGQKAVSEYDPHVKTWLLAFPWLFPGGRGDFISPKLRKQSLSNWMKRLINYKDGRFATDKMWGFYAMDYLQRHDNQSDGNFFVDGFINGGSKTLDKLKTQILQGNTQWVDKLT